MSFIIRQNNLANELSEYVKNLAIEFTVQLTPIFNGDFDLKLFSDKANNC